MKFVHLICDPISRGGDVNISLFGFIAENNA